uniref:procollagen-proline 4-dioxygenase n=1 Tax=Steinernema glaseri TaxID=37863 RepID=A0A1I8AHF3_9BILA
MRLLLLVALVAIGARADLFTSVADLQKLLTAEQDIPSIIERYISLEKQRIAELQDFVAKYEENNARLAKNGVQEVMNPINAFRLIKEMTSTWKEVEHKMRNNNADFFIRNFTETRTSAYPTAEDLSGAATGLLRLQDTYRLDTTDLANGKIRKIQYSRPFSAHDCFEIGRVAYNAEDFYHTILWMEEAKKRVVKEDPPTASMEDILEYLGFSMYKQGNLKHALKLTEELYRIAPSHPRAKGNVKWYEDLLEQEGVRRSDMRRNIPAVVNIRPTEALENVERDIYEALCRDEVPVSQKATSQLYCYYKRDRPFLILAPFKVEILRFNPLAVLFKEVMSDDEIEVIQELAKPKLNRATVQNSVTGQLETASYRISKSAWLKGYEHEVVDRVNQRIDLMTNLEQETAEELQIANYGIGGHYDPHFDFARKEEVKSFESLGTGNRIATVLFYMSQPEMGGGTVFTELKTTVMPSHHDALFWYNLYRSGEGDLRTRHAACPVLTGVKWVSNKWIHELGQEFRRPCGLKPHTQEQFVGDLGGPSPRDHPNFRS